MRVIFSSVLVSAMLLSGCVAQPPGDLPTLVVLPSATPTREEVAVAEALLSATSSDMLTATPTPTVTTTPQTYYAFSSLTDLVYVYDCPQLTCGIIAALNRNDPVQVVAHDVDGWSTVLLDNGALVYVRAADLLTSTATPGATSTGGTTTASATPTPTVTRTPTPVWTLALPTTAVPTLGVDLSFLTRTLAPGVVRLLPGADNPDATPAPPTQRVILPTPLRTFPATLTPTPSRTPTLTPTFTLGAPIGTPQAPPTLAATPTPAPPTNTTAPVNTPPGAGDTAPTPTFGPPGSTPPPFSGAMPTTSGGPPGIINTPPGA